MIERNIKRKAMNNTLLIRATFDQPGLLEDFVEKLAHRRYDMGYGEAVVPTNLKAIETSSAEMYVTGTVAIADRDETINMPFITRFLFTCKKENGGSYKLDGSFSLS
jgi:hypothetical protein